MASDLQSLCFDKLSMTDLTDISNYSVLRKGTLNTQTPEMQLGCFVYLQIWCFDKLSMTDLTDVSNYSVLCKGTHQLKTPEAQLRAFCLSLIL